MVRPFQGLPIDTASHWPSAARRCCIGDTKDLPATIWIMKQDAYRYVVLSISCPCLLIFVQLSQKTTLIIFVVNAKHVTSHLHSRPQKKYQPAYSLPTSGDILLRARGLFVATWHGPHFPFKPVIASHTSGTPTILLNTHEKYLVYATTLPREVSTCCFRLYVAWRIGLECLDAAPVPGRQAFHGRALLGPRRVMCAVCVCYSLGHYPLFHLLSFFLPFLFLSPIHPQLTIPPPPRLQPPTASNSDNTLYTNHPHTSFLLFSAALLFITISCTRIPPKQDPTRYNPKPTSNQILQQ